MSVVTELSVPRGEVEMSFFRAYTRSKRQPTYTGHKPERSICQVSALLNWVALSNF